MSAREEVLRNLRGYEPREEVADDPAAQMLDAYRAEVLRETAALQRLRMEELDLTGQKARVVSRFISLIDPDTP